MSRIKKLIWILIVTVLLFSLFVGCSQAKKENAAVAGKYYCETNDDFIEFKSDGKFELKQADQSFTGDYKNENSQITLKVDGGMEATGKIEGDTFTDNDGLKWIKK